MQINGWVKNLLRQFSAEASIAFETYDGEKITSITYAQFTKDILQAAGYFAENQLTGRHIAIVAPNSYRWMVVFFALVATGNKAILLNHDLPEDIMQQQCKKADVNMICYDDVNTAKKFGTISHIHFDAVYGEASLNIESIYSHNENETVLMMLTSGTTGESKVVEITAGNIQYSMKNLDPSYAVTGMERLFTPIPFYHVAGLTTVLEALNQRKTECLGRGIRYMFMDMPILNPTTINAVPSILESLLKILKKAKSRQECTKYIGKDLSLICVSGAVLKPAISRFFKEKGFNISVYYGMSEVTGAATWTMLEEDNLGVTGKFCKHTEYSFQDGELLLKGPTLMKGYYKDPAETQKVIGDGWIHTGDMGYCDDDGYLYLTGRKKNVIILSNGENVNPEEIEAAFGECRAIEECMVYNDGKGICADVYTSDQCSAQAYIDQYNRDMPMYRQVYKVNFTNEPLPKTGNGKIKRKENV